MLPDFFAFGKTRFTLPYLAASFAALSDQIPVRKESCYGFYYFGQYSLTGNGIICRTGSIDQIHGDRCKGASATPLHKEDFVVVWNLPRKKKRCLSET